MGRKRKRSDSGGGGCLGWLVLLLGLGVYGTVAQALADVEYPRTSTIILAALIFVPIVILGIWLALPAGTSFTNKGAKLRALQLSNVDNMGGVEFENYVKALLIHRGFTVETTKASGDLGVDLVVMGRDGWRIAIQVKRQRNPVSRRAVSDAVGGKAHYGCRTAMVVTNNYFSPGARQLAMSNHCELVDRDVLTQWIMDFQSGSRTSGREPSDA